MEKIAAQQVGHRAVLEPMAMQPPFGAGVDEAIEREGLQNEIPARAFATFRQQFAPESVEPELTPKLASKPASAPLTRLSQRHLIEPHADDRPRIRVRIFHGRVVLREQRDLLRSIVILTKELDGFAPRSFLPTVEFAEVKHMSLDDAIMLAALAFDNTPVAVLFAILEPF